MPDDSVVFIENLFSRPGGIKAIGEALGLSTQQIVGLLGALSNSVATSLVQGKVDLSQDAFLTQQEYLRNIYNRLITLASGGIRPPFRRQIVPGDATTWVNIGVDNSSGVPIAGPFPSYGGSAFNAPFSPSFLPVAPFSTPQSYFDFGAQIGNMATTEAFTYGFVKDDQQIIQLNVCFKLPRVVPNGSAPTNSGFGAGFGITSDPPSNGTWVGVWITPDTSGSGGNWVRPWPIIVSIGRWSSHQSFRIADLGVPAGDAMPGGITISWNHASVAVSLYRSQYGMPTTPGTNPQWWIYPVNQWQWPFPWPYLEQTLVGLWGDTNFYPSAVPVSTPGPIPTKAMITWPSMVVSQIEIEETQYFPPLPGQTTVPPPQVAVNGAGLAPAVASPTPPPVFFLPFSLVPSHGAQSISDAQGASQQEQQAYTIYAQLLAYYDQEVNLGVANAVMRRTAFLNTVTPTGSTTSSLSLFIYYCVLGSVSPTALFNPQIAAEAAFIAAWRTAFPFTSGINPQSLLLEPFYPTS